MYMHTNVHIYVNICITIHKYVYICQPTQSIMYVPLQVNRFKKFILLVVQYKYLKSCSRRFYCPNLILRTRLCDTMFTTQPSCLFYFHLTEFVRRKWFVLAVYQFWKGISAGPALKYFTWFIGAGGYVYLHLCWYTWTHIHTYTHMWMYGCIRVYIHVFLFVYVYIHLCIFEYMYKCILYIYIYINIKLYIYK